MLGMYRSGRRKGSAERLKRNMTFGTGHRGADPLPYSLNGCMSLLISTGAADFVASPDISSIINHLYGNVSQVLTTTRDQSFCKD